MKADIALTPLSFQPTLHFVQNEAWWLLITLGLTLGATKGICYAIGPPWIWKSIDSVLDRLREYAFRTAPEDAHHHHRVTLFRRKSCRLRIWPARGSVFWPWGLKKSPCAGWLVPVARSGHTTQRTNTVFLASDNSPNDAEGVVGQTWVRQGTLYVPSLPDLEGANSSAEDIATYAKNTWISDELLRKRITAGRSLARCYLGIPVLVKGKPWGVLILDSRRPKGIRTPARQASAVYQATAQFLSTLLERA